jgi:OOP family OmpA-OmpF porin
MSNSKIWWVLVAVWIAGSTYWHVCRIKQLCDSPLILPQNSSVIPIVAPLVISDSSFLTLRSKGNFVFAKNSADPEITSVLPQLDSLYNYLSSHNNKQLIITGSFSSEEADPTTSVNLGEMRALAIKRWFLAKGLADSLITVNGVRTKHMIFQQDSLFGGIHFDIRNTDIMPQSHIQHETGLAKKEKYESIFKPIDLYFPTASFQYIKTEQNQLFINEAKKILLQNANKKLWLTGHTDNEDSAEWNLILSKKRANFVKNQFIKMGLPADRIVTEGKGEYNPKASNETRSGKMANRRVSIVVR